MLDQGAKLGLLQAARIVWLSNLGKYAPGRIWGIVGAGVLAKEYRISSWDAAGVTLVLQVLTLATGMIAAGVFASEPLSTWTVGGVLSRDRGWGIGDLVVSIFRRCAGNRFHVSAMSRIPKIQLSTWIVVFALDLYLAGIRYGFDFDGTILVWILQIPWSTAVGVFAASYVLVFSLCLLRRVLDQRGGVRGSFSVGSDPLHAVALALVSRIVVTVWDLVFALPFLRGELGGPDSK